MYLGTIKDSVLGAETIAHYLLFTLNKLNPECYKKMFNLPQPTEDIDVLLPAIAKKIGANLKGGKLDTEHAAHYFIEKFRSGDFGRYTLDEIPQDEPLLLNGL